MTTNNNSDACFAPLFCTAAVPQSSGVARIRTEVTTVDPAAWPPALSVSDGAVATGVIPEIHLILWKGHVRTASRCIVHLVVAVRLCVGVDYEAVQFLLLCYGDSARPGTANIICVARTDNGTSGLTPQGSGVRGRRARLCSARKHARPRTPAADGRAGCCLELTLLLGRVGEWHPNTPTIFAESFGIVADPGSRMIGIRTAIRTLTRVLGVPRAGASAKRVRPLHLLLAAYPISVIGAIIRSHQQPLAVIRLGRTSRLTAAQDFPSVPKHAGKVGRRYGGHLRLQQPFPSTTRFGNRLLELFEGPKTPMDRHRELLLACGARQRNREHVALADPDVDFLDL
jgi:hypothetical protein